MNLINIAVGSIITLSIILNFYLYRRTKLLRKIPAPSIEALQMLHDLTHGGAIVKVTVLDPSGLLIYKGNFK